MFCGQKLDSSFLPWLSRSELRCACLHSPDRIAGSAAGISAHSSTDNRSTASLLSLRAAYQRKVGQAAARDAKCDIVTCSRHKWDGNFPRDKHTHTWTSTHTHSHTHTPTTHIQIHSTHTKPHTLSQAQIHTLIHHTHTYKYTYT